MAEIDNINDRKILILLLYKDNKSYCEKRRIKRLKRIYTDYQNHEQHLISELLDSKHLGRTLLEKGETDTFNRPLSPDKYSEPYITERGLCALKNGDFQSESVERWKRKWYWRIDVFCKILAIIGGLYAIIEIIRSF